MPGVMAMRYFDGLRFCLPCVFFHSYLHNVIFIPWAGLTVELLEGDCCLWQLLILERTNLYIHVYKPEVLLEIRSEKLSPL